MANVATKMILRNIENRAYSSLDIPEIRSASETSGVAARSNVCAFPGGRLSNNKVIDEIVMISQNRRARCNARPCKTTRSGVAMGVEDATNYFLQYLY